MRAQNVHTKRRSDTFVRPLIMLIAFERINICFRREPRRQTIHSIHQNQKAFVWICGARCYFATRWSWSSSRQHTTYAAEYCLFAGALAGACTLRPRQIYFLWIFFCVRNIILAKLRVGGHGVRLCVRVCVCVPEHFENYRSDVVAIAGLHAGHFYLRANLAHLFIAYFVSCPFIGLCHRRSIRSSGRTTH